MRIVSPNDAHDFGKRCLLLNEYTTKALRALRSASKKNKL